MDRVLLVRHAEAAGHEGADPGLSEVGAQQARSLAEYLAEEDVRQVSSGPKRRARQTAEAVAERLGQTSSTTELLDDLTPVPSAGRWHDYPEHRWPWLRETPADEQDEDAVAIETGWARLSDGIGDDHGGGTLVLVTHAFVIAAIVGRVLRAEPSAWMRLPVANTGVTELRFRENGEIAMTRFNDLAHLSRD